MKSKKDEPGAHGLSRNAAKELHRAQVQGAAPTMIAANGKDAGGYKIAEHEKHLFHVELEIPQYNVTSGAKLSTPSVQMYTPKEFEATKANGGFAGYATKILHNPTATNATTENPDLDMGEAAEGTRVVDSNYAVMQDAYEAFTGEKPDPTLTATQLDAAVKTARLMYNRAKGGHAPAPIDQSKAEPNTPAVVATPATVAAIVTANATDATGKDDAAAAAKVVAENTPPTLDGNTSVGTGTIAAADTESAATTGTAGTVSGTDATAPNNDATGSEKDGEKGKEETAAPSGRRGAPVSTRPSAKRATADKAE